MCKRATDPALEHAAKTLAEEACALGKILVWKEGSNAYAMNSCRNATGSLLYKCMGMFD